MARTHGDLEGAVSLLQRGAALLAKGPGSAAILAEIERDLGAALAVQGDKAGARAARERAADLYRRLGAARAADAIAALASGPVNAPPGASRA